MSSTTGQSSAHHPASTEKQAPTQKLALTGTTGKIGGAVLASILKHNLHPVSQLIICTSSPPSDARWSQLRSQGAEIRAFNYDDPASMLAAFQGCTKLFLVSSPNVELDFHDPPDGQGRERHHLAAIRAAGQAGIKHVYYTSLAFGSDSQAVVMRAHTRTESYLATQLPQGMSYTALREGLYNESWPLYFGYYDPKHDTRSEIVVAGDGPVSRTAIADLGLASALVVTADSKQYEARTLYLSTPKASATTLAQIAQLVSEIKGSEVKVKVVSEAEYRRYYIEERGRDRDAVEWWSSTYAALTTGECAIEDETLTALLASKGVEAKSVETTIREMLS